MITAQKISVPQSIEDDDVIVHSSSAKTAKRVNIDAQVEDDDTDEDVKIKPSFKPTLEDHNDFFANLKSQLQEDNFDEE